MTNLQRSHTQGYLYALHMPSAWNSSKSSYRQFYSSETYLIQITIQRPYRMVTAWFLLAAIAMWMIWVSWLPSDEIVICIAFSYAVLLLSLYFSFSLSISLFSSTQNEPEISVILTTTLFSFLLFLFFLLVWLCNLLKILVSLSTFKIQKCIPIIFAFLHWLRKLFSLRSLQVFAFFGGKRMKMLTIQQRLQGLLCPFRLHSRQCMVRWLRIVFWSLFKLTGFFFL